MSTYSRTEDANNYYYYQTEVPIYGNYRLGEYITDTWVKTVKKNNYHIGPFYYPGYASDNTINIVANSRTINKHINVNGVWVIRTLTVQYNPASSYSISIPNSIGHFYRKISQKDYELIDQLSDVKVTVSDRKDSANNAIMLSYNNEYGYGMIQPGREYNAGSYRFAHNGMEHDDNIYGINNSYNTLNREYDPRVGRWWSTDPIMHPNQGSYIGMDNDPYLYTDVLGDETVWQKIKNIFKKGFGKAKYHISGEAKKRSPKKYYVLRNETDMQKTGDIFGNWLDRYVSLGTGLVSEEYKNDKERKLAEGIISSLPPSAQEIMRTHTLDLNNPFLYRKNWTNELSRIGAHPSEDSSWHQEEDYVVPDANMNIDQVQIDILSGPPAGHIFQVYQNGKMVPSPSQKGATIKINVQAGDVIRIVLSRSAVSQMLQAGIGGGIGGMTYTLSILSTK